MKIINLIYRLSCKYVCRLNDNMEISKDTKEILGFLEYSSGGNLRKKEDLGIILEYGAKFGENELIDNILLKGSSLWNLKQTLSRLNSNDENISTLDSEINHNSEELKYNIKRIIGDEVPEITEHFLMIYFEDGQIAFGNLLDLAHDIAELNNVRKKIKEGI